MDGVEETKAMPAVAASPGAEGTAATPTPVRTNRTSPWIRVAIVVLLLLLGAGAAFAGGACSLLPSPGQVPNVAGSTVASATQALTVAGFTLGSQETTASATLAKDLVVSTDPPAGVQLAHGQTVALVVSLGPAMVAVPDVVGSTESSALAAVQAAGLAVNVNEAYDPQTNAGLVYKTDPTTGTAVAQQTLVQIYVSTNAQSGGTGTGSGGTGTGSGGTATGSGGTGAHMVTVPDVRGKLLDYAIGALQAKGFAVKWAGRSSSTVPIAHVISQDPLAGTPKPKGSLVTLSSSTGPLVPNILKVPKVTVPALYNLTSSKASSILAALGLKADPQPGDPAPNSTFKDVVEDQTELAGTKVPIGATIHFRVFH